MNKALEYILARFPDHQDEITELFSRDEDFRILSEDYLTSMQSLLECRLNVNKNKEFESDFLEAHTELEKEIIHLLARKTN